MGVWWTARPESSPYPESGVTHDIILVAQRGRAGHNGGMKKPNILYFVAHDCGRHLGAYGARVATPNLDAFASTAARFDRAFCSSPACSPSRICAMTGLYAHVSGGVGLAHMGWPLAADVPTIVDRLNDAGYETIHSGMEHERHPGLNRYQVDRQENWDDFRTDVAVDKALACLGARDRKRPFYLNVGSQQPHASTWHRVDEWHGGAVPPDDVYLPPFLPDRPALRAAFGRFQAAMRFMDAHFGRLIEGLSRLGHDRDTVVVFTTDHGIAAPRAKGTLYERGVETALLIRMPDGVCAGAAIDRLTPNIDLVPTLLEAAGADVPANLPGRSFWPLLRGRPCAAHDAIFTERNFHGEQRVHGREGDFIDRYDPVRAVRTDRFHYIRYFDPGVKGQPWLPFETPVDGIAGEWGLPAPRRPRPEEELFDVMQDPQEFVDLAARPEYRAVKADLSARLRRWMEETDDFALRGDVPRRPEPPGWGPWEGR